MRKPRLRIQLALRLIALDLLLCAAAAWAGVAGSISGTVRDSSGDVLPHAIVTMQEIDTGISPVSYTHLDVYKRQGEGRGVDVAGRS